MFRYYRSTIVTLRILDEEHQTGRMVETGTLLGTRVYDATQD